jgi:hemerythrin
MIAWDDSMTTGLPEIDAQHKEIVEKLMSFPRL